MFCYCCILLIFDFWNCSWHAFKMHPFRKLWNVNIIRCSWWRHWSSVFLYNIKDSKIETVLFVTWTLKDQKERRRNKVTTEVPARGTEQWAKGCGCLWATQGMTVPSNLLKDHSSTNIPISVSGKWRTPTSFRRRW